MAVVGKPQWVSMAWTEASRSCSYRHSAGCGKASPGPEGPGLLAMLCAQPAARREAWRVLGAAGSCPEPEIRQGRIGGQDGPDGGQIIGGEVKRCPQVLQEPAEGIGPARRVAVLEEELRMRKGPVVEVGLKSVWQFSLIASAVTGGWRRAEHQAGDGGNQAFGAVLGQAVWRARARVMKARGSDRAQHPGHGIQDVVGQRRAAAADGKEEHAVFAAGAGLRQRRAGRQAAGSAPRSRCQTGPAG